MLARVLAKLTTPFAFASYGALLLIVGALLLAWRLEGR